MSEKGLKEDGEGKQMWHPMPLVLLEPLANAFVAGTKKYKIFSCLGEFENPDATFYDAMVRHLNQCQLNPLAIDKEIYNKYGIVVYHSAQIAFNSLMRIYHCKKEREKKS